MSLGSLSWLVISKRQSETGELVAIFTASHSPLLRQCLMQSGWVVGGRCSKTLNFLSDPLLLWRHSLQWLHPEDYKDMKLWNLKCVSKNMCLNLLASMVQNASCVGSQGNWKQCFGNNVWSYQNHERDTPWAWAKRDSSSNVSSNASPQTRGCCASFSKTPSK